LRPLWRCTLECCLSCSTLVGLAVLHLRENGELATLQKKWWQDKGECVGDDQKVGIIPKLRSVSFVRAFFQ